MKKTTSWQKLKSRLGYNRKAGVRTKKKTKSYWNADELEGFTMTNKDIIMGVGSVDEYISGTIQQNRFLELIPTFNLKTKIVATKKDWNEFLYGKYKNKYRIIQSRDYSGWVVDDSTNSYIDYYVSGDTASINLVGDESFVNANKELIESTFQVVQSYIKWIHNSDGSFITLALNDTMLPIDAMYPFLNGEKLTDYYDRFMKSTASILLLIGPPGTGKCLDPSEKICIAVSDEIYEKLIE